MTILNTDPREIALRDIVRQQQEAWNRGDASAWAAVFSDDARFITLRGDVLPGRQAIEKSHGMIFNSFYKGSHNTTSVEDVRFVAADVAILDVMHEVTEYAFLPPGVAPTEPGVLRARMRFVATLKDGKWRFISAQNTAVFPKPAAPPAQPLR